LAKTPGKAARRVRGQYAEERAPGRHPRQRSLQDADEELALMQLTHDQGGERPSPSEVGAEQNAADVKPCIEKVAT
jgi:hypothetical protein